MVSKHSYLLGNLLSRPIALWKEPQTYVVIISEFVGEAVTRGFGSFAKTVLLVGGKVLDSKEYGLSFNILLFMHLECWIALDYGMGTWTKEY